MSKFEKRAEMSVDDLVTKTRDLGTDQWRILEYGQAKVGKTRSAYTISSFWVDKPTKEVELSDCLSISADRNALVGLKAEGFIVPEFDIRRLISSGKVRDIKEALKQAYRVADEYVTNRGVKNVIVDTISMLDFEIVKYMFAPENVPRTRDDAVDSQAAYREVLNIHGNFWQDMDSLQCRVIFLCHATVNNEAVKEKKKDIDEAKLTVSSLAGADNDVKPEITGKAFNLYMRNVDLILPMKMFGDAGTSSCERKFLPYGGAGMTGGNRYHHVLKQEEEAHLGKLLKKIEAGSAKLNTNS
jgi:hypothetical protein